MGGNGKHRWKISFYRSNSSARQPPKELLCPISGSLMSDPVVVSSGQTFERLSVQVCRELNFYPKLDDGTQPDLSTVISNLAIKSTINNWCRQNNVDHPPTPPNFVSVEKTVRAMMAVDPEHQRLRASERELLNGVAERPPVVFTHAATELTRLVDHFYSSSSEDSMVIPKFTTEAVGDSNSREFETLRVSDMERKP